MGDSLPGMTGINIEHGDHDCFSTTLATSTQPLGVQPFLREAPATIPPTRRAVMGTDPAAHKSGWGSAAKPHSGCDETRLKQIAG